MKKPRTPTPVITAVLTLITLFFWAGFEIYRSFTTKEVPPVPKEIIAPLDPTLDTKVLDSINGRLFLSDQEIGTIQIATPSASPSPTPSASPTAVPTATP